LPSSASICRCCRPTRDTPDRSARRSLLTLPPPPAGPGREGRVRGPLRRLAAIHLTLPSLRDGPLPLPQKGGEGTIVLADAATPGSARSHARNRARFLDTPWALSAPHG
jgi:hypothetical protein